MTKEQLMQRAILLSENSVRHGGGPFGAVIAKDGVIVAEASNSVTIDQDPTAHAEVNAIRMATRALPCVLALSTGRISTVSIMPTIVRMQRRLVSMMSLFTRRSTAR